MEEFVLKSKILEDVRKQYLQHLEGAIEKNRVGQEKEYIYTSSSSFTYNKLKKLGENLDRVYRDIPESVREHSSKNPRGRIPNSLYEFVALFGEQSNNNSLKDEQRDLWQSSHITMSPNFGL